MVPVYIINGFLDSGKTEFITYTLKQPYFQINGSTLLILCEQGQQDYDDLLLNESKTVLEVIDQEIMLLPSTLLELEKKHKPERIMIEFNGMWNYKKVKLPLHWEIEQQVTMIDASTFSLYFTNMKSLLAEMVRKSEMIIFNRCDGIKELASFKRNMKAVNQKAEIIFEDSYGEIEEMIEVNLPYQITDDCISLTHETYAIWYFDVLEHLEQYVDKTVTFVAQVLKVADFPNNYFVSGRKAMTCCEDDIAFLGFACEYSCSNELMNKQWVSVTAIVKKEFFELYRGEGPILKAIEVVPCNALKEETITFM